MKKWHSAVAGAAVLAVGAFALAPALAQAEPDMDALMAAGAEAYEDNCAGCHGAEGGGGAGPALAGNTSLSSGRGVVAQILAGAAQGMPPFADALDDNEIAAIATFIRNSWGNAFGIVVPATVANQRG